MLDHLTAGWRAVHRVEAAIAPGNRAPRGLAVMQAILSYVGRPVRVWEGGRWRSRPGWGLTRRAGLPGLGRRWLSLVDTPDLDLIPARFAVRNTAVFRAGLELPVLHLGLLAIGMPVRWGLVRSLVPCARPARWLADLLYRFGTDRGGMLVEAWGVDAKGRPAQASWSLLAEAGDGPFIPTLPALACLRAWSARPPVPGARVCVGELTLAQIEAEFTGLHIRSAFASK